METKYCPSCKERKPISAFNKNRNNPDGLAWYCKVCKAQERVKWKAKNREAYRKQRRDYARWYSKTPVGRFTKIRKEAKRKGIAVTMLKEDFVKWLTTQEIVCYYCGQKLNDNATEHSENILTIDRKDNKQGYAIDNIVLSCFKCNIIKGSWFSSQQMSEIAERYLKV